ncbi:MAG: GTPase, partial [Cypionkella sp.]
MGFKMGIVGLPNVGKSTLFNALTRTAAAQAANFPFCTIEPNVGEVAVPDARLDKLAAIAGSKQIIPTRMTFVDIAGLVRGASKGEGLGNQFLANIRECDAVAHVLRCFEDGDITHVEGKIDPVADAETIETELMIADMESIERRLTGLAKKLRGGDQDTLDQDRLLRAALKLLEAGHPARNLQIAGSQEIIPTRITFVDIAGLVRGASKGEGLGNQFLANIREVDAVVHVLRCFEDDDITHVEGKIDPISDAETVETELMLADLE